MFDTFQRVAIGKSGSLNLIQHSLVTPARQPNRGLSIGLRLASEIEPSQM
jgi:hypothetical protein